MPVNRSLTPEERLFLVGLARELNHQDNSGTYQPLFTVQVEVQECGFDPTYGGDIVWISSDGDIRVTHESDSERFTRLEEGTFGEDDGDQDDWTRTGYVTREEHVQTFLTKESAQQYIRCNSHRHRGSLRIHVETAYRNFELARIRELLRGPILHTLKPSRKFRARDAVAKSFRRRHRC